MKTIVLSLKPICALLNWDIKHIEAKAGKNAIAHDELWKHFKDDDGVESYESREILADPLRSFLEHRDRLRAGERIGQLVLFLSTARESTCGPCEERTLV